MSFLQSGLIVTISSGLFFAIVNLLLHRFLRRMAREKSLLAEAGSKEGRESKPNAESLALKKANKAHWEYITNVSSILHAVACRVWIFVVLRENGVQFERRNSSSELNIVFFSLGYFLTETLLGRRHQASSSATSTS